MKDFKSLDLHEPATFFEGDEGELPRGMAFDHLSQALRHAANVPLSRQRPSAKIVTRSGLQLGWEEMTTLHEHLRTKDSKTHGN
ncbi:hypothetical protein J1C56_27260 [Aminobacter anthyllidis]|uniref:Uncharacterized protein n=1 Tax=Aminobacter anthyllidis TaxID=1035067 RepID=A0A9X1AGM3_9HYPH|nr:hypothetical protein [Aminobacter anthyllidis]MBT1159283.1 hypothetical protein [Aminobacter anthyllidis]